VQQFYWEKKMKTFRPRFLMVAGLAGAAGLLANVNCGSSGGGTGGTTGSGGTSSTGGKGGSGTGTGGSGTGGSATGGKGGSGTGGSATGGSTSTGGTAGSGTGGAAGAGTGGSAGAGGKAGAGGATGGAGGAAGSNTDGGAATAAFDFSFDKNVEGFSLNTYNSGGNLADADGGSKVTLSWDNTVGSPGSSPLGSLKLDATFTDYNQYALISTGTQPWINGTGKTAQVWVLLDAIDGGHSFAGGIQLEAASGTSYAGAYGAYTTLTPGTWKEITLPLTASGSFDPAQLIQFSVNFGTGSKPDGGTFAGPVHAVFHIDSLSDGGTPPAPLAPNATFDKNTQGFTVAANGHPDGAATPTLTWDGTTGQPASPAGSIETTLPFNNYVQSYFIQSSVQPTADLSGKTLHANVMLDKVDGGASSIPGGYVQLFVQSNGYKFAQGAGAGLTAGQWTALTMTVSTPNGTPATGYDPTQIIQVGVQIGTGGMPDGGTFGAEIMPRIHIDSIVAQ
jgi:hypothetical protein